MANTGRIPAAIPQEIMPASSGAVVLFREQLYNAGVPRIFRVFETNGEDVSSFKGRFVPMLSASAAPDKLVRDFDPSTSVILTISPDEPAFPLWHRRNFVVVACSADNLLAWGMITARVSNPLLSNAICFLVALVAYLLAMLAVWKSRRTPHVLTVKYPAIFGARRLSGHDFINPIHLTVNSFNQASVQKLQVILFSFLVGWLVLSLVLETGTLVDLSPTVVGLLGISGIGAAAAQITFQQRTRLSFENWAWLEKKHVLKIPDPADQSGPNWRDLVLTNREFDIYKLQTLVFSFVVACAMVVAGSSRLATFSVPDALLGILGLSQVVYVGGILVRPPAVDDLDDALTKLRAAGETVAAAKVRGTDTDAAGKLLDTLPPGAQIGANAQRQYDDLADAIIPMIESTLEVAADRTKL